MGIKTLVYFIFTTAISSSIGIILALAVNPGKGFIYEYSGNNITTKALTFKEMFLQLLPTNFLILCQVAICYL